MASSIQSSNVGAANPEAATQPSTAEDLSKSDLWIFREGRQEVSGPAFLRDLLRAIKARESVLDCLIHAGELEAALADAEGPGTAAAADVTDTLALQLCTDTVTDDAARLTERIETASVISISPPEGFTYYALHPLDFARAAEQISAKSNLFAVVGIRSIGSTLSAVVSAALRAQGKIAERITVRPTGHPYSRNTRFLQEQELWIVQQNSKAARFLIVDEGPGRSGSTFLSAAEGLLQLGVPRDRITIIGSRPFDPQSLCAQDAAKRWRQFEFLSVPSSASSRFEGWRYLGGGDWRIYFYESEHQWPESWTQMERFKVLSPGGGEFVKFEGMGRIGREARERAHVLAEAGLSPATLNAADGFISYATVQGKPLRGQDLNRATLEQIARYCAFRFTEFKYGESRVSEIEHMLVYNIQQEFGRELKLVPGQLSSQPVLVDGRMQPYEWITCNSGKVLKTDAISHGDNHFFPGPCGIGWDLAGSVVEWELNENAKEYLLSSFRSHSGIDLAKDFTLYALAYCVFRLGFCKMGRSSVLGSREENRLDSAYRYYRAKASRLLDSLKVSLS